MSELSYTEAMEKSARYIEEHPDLEITAAGLADMAGYSLYHFCHVFRAYFDMPVGAYIRRCRLRLAASDIADGSPVLDTALQYGFETNAGFTKAFTREFGVSPAAYRASDRKEMKNMEPVFKKMGAFRAIGYSIHPKEGDAIDAADSCAYWSGIDFTKLPAYPQGANDRGEVAAWTHPADVSGELSYFFGYKTEDRHVPDGFVALDFPEAEYAVFDAAPANDAAQMAAGVKAVWKYIFGSWFDKSGYAFDEKKMCFEFYINNKAQIFIPVKLK